MNEQGAFYFSKKLQNDTQAGLSQSRRERLKVCSNWGVECNEKAPAHVLVHIWEI